MGFAKIRHSIRLATIAVVAMGALLQAPRVWSQEQALTPEDLYAYPHRPSIAEIYEANRAEIDHGVSQVQPDQLAPYENLATAIALAEHIYPNLTYAMLGRDSAYLGDLLDAFYLANGQPGRVRFLNGSGDSIRPATPEQLFLFLRQNGLKLSKDGLERPFVVLDRTSFGSGSQVRLLTQAAASLLIDAGFAPELLSRQIGAANTAADVNLEQAKTFDPHAYFSHQGPQKPLTLPVASYTDTAFWHDTFGSFHIDPSGRIFAKPGSALGSRNIVMLQWTNGLSVVMSPKFLEMVHAKAKEIGYQFPIQEKPKQKMIMTPFEAWTAAGAAKSFEERAAVLRFISWFQGSADQRLKILGRLNLMTEDYQKRREALIAKFSSKMPEMVLKVAEAISSFDILTQAYENEVSDTSNQRKQLTVSLMQRELMDAFESVVILDEQSGKLRGTPAFQAALQGLLEKPEKKSTIAVLKDLEARWSTQILRPMTESAGRFWTRAQDFYKNKWKVPMTMGERLSYSIYSAASLLPVDTLLLQFAPSLDTSTVVGLNLGVAMAAFQYFKFAWSKPIPAHGTVTGTAVQFSTMETQKARSSIAKNPDLFLSTLQPKGLRACLPSLMRKGK